MLERLTLRDMAAQVRHGEISPVELVKAHLKRIEEQDPRLNAFIRGLGKQALAQARLAESQPAMGPLHGVPLTIKDSFDVADVPTSAGSRLHNRATPTRDATAVARLRAAGAIFLGKTNVPELVSSYETDNDVTGRCNNPWDPERTPGGSSGGEAAAIASFCSPGGLGSDGGGSIRIPAHFCGIAGFKPTHRRIGGGGMFPESLPPAGLMTAPGPMARTVADVRLLFEVMQGEDDRDSMYVARSADSPQDVPKIGVWRQFYKIAVDPAIAAAVDDAALKLRDCGFEVEECTIEGMERAPNVWAFFFAELGTHRTREILAGREAEAHWTITENLRDAPPADAKMIVAQFAERERLRALVLDQMQRYAVILMPPCSIPAFRHRERRFAVGDQQIGLFAAMACSTIWNLLGFPALAMPYSRTGDGMPVGVQLVGRPFEDELILEIGERLEEARGVLPSVP